MCSRASSQQQRDISADGTFILQGLVLLAPVSSPSDKSGASRLSELQRALWKKTPKKTNKTKRADANEIQSGGTTDLSATEPSANDNHNKTQRY